MENDLISRSAVDMDLQNLIREYNRNCESDKSSGAFEALYRLRLAPTVDAVPVEKLGKWGKLFIPYKGCPRGHVGRMGLPATLEDEALRWGVITDVDGGRWVPVVEAVLHELIAKAKAYDAAREIDR